jgi:hypothetical protein
MAAERRTSTRAQSGPGAQCSEAQADGVPCACLGVDCEVCNRRSDAVAEIPQPATQGSHA